MKAKYTIQVEKRAREYPKFDRVGNRQDMRDYAAKPKAYVFLEGESIFDNLVNRRNRPVKAYRGLLEMALADIGEEEATYYWNQKAGCSCGCSPGFILSNTKDNKFDIFITLKQEKVEEEVEPVKAAA